jgi:hypothetical protein
MNSSQKILTLMNLARKHDPHPFARLERGKPVVKGREAVAGLIEKGQEAANPKTILLQSAFYVCFDCFKEAHNIAQDHEGLIGNWLHAILHRREPDAGNSKYWYDRVKLPGKVSQGIAEESLKLLKSLSLQELEPLQRKMSKSGAWEPEIFVDLCDQFRPKDPSSLAYWTLAKIQEIEWWCLVEFILTT